MSRVFSRPRRVVPLVGVLLALLASVGGGSRTAEAAPSVVYFPVTGHNVGDQFLTAWRERGGLPIVGYPLTDPIEVNGMTVQYFERARFELHPEAAGSVWEIQGELLGSWIAAGKTEPAFAPLPGDDIPAGDASHRFFPETRHYLSNGFKAYWEDHGELPGFGYPISEEFSENGFTVQYFERARFEWHPENAGTPYEILLGRLGADRAAADGIDISPVDRLDGAPDYDPGLFSQSFRLPVLMYHRFGDPAERYQLPYWAFAQQLDWLQANGYTTITMAQAYDALAGDGTLPDKPVVLTFDDAFESQWDVVQLLDERGMHGVFFITTGQTRLEDWQIQQMAAEGHEIEAHTIHHPDLTSLSDDQLMAELLEPKDFLEGLTGRPVDFFAYPYGLYDDRVIAAVQRAGYRGALAAWGGAAWTPGKWWVEPRIEIDGGVSLDTFAAYVDGSLATYRVEWNSAD